MIAYMNTIHLTSGWVEQILQGDLSARHMSALILFLIFNVSLLMMVVYETIRALKRREHNCEPDIKVFFAE
jgi:hypothetical protein